MKPSTLLIAASLAANAALAAAFVFKPSLAPPAFRDFLARRSSTDSASSSARPGSPGTTVAPVATSPVAVGTDAWSSLQTDDLKTLIARLRAAGFPPTVIRAVISAQLQKQLSARLLGLFGDPTEYPFWKPDILNGDGARSVLDEYSRLSRESSQLMRQLLGEDYLAGGAADLAEVQRRQYGDLPKEKIEKLERILADYSDLTSQARSAMRNITLPEDQEKLAFLEQEKRKDLAALLTPQELEDYEMRSSTTTSRLRSAMTAMNATEDEFRTIFRVQHQYNDVLNPPAGIRTPEQNQLRIETTARMNEQIKASLGDARYADYARANTSEYQQLTRVAQRENIPTEVANRAFAVRDTVALESNRIAADTSLNADQKRAALTSLVQSARAQIVATLGRTAGDTYLQSATWLGNVERGNVVTFGPDFQPSYRPVVAPAAGGRGGAASPAVQADRIIIQGDQIISIRPGG